MHDGTLALSHEALALSHGGGIPEIEEKATKHARTTLEAEIQKKYDATHAALEAAQKVGGDDRLEDTLQQRLKSIARQFRAVGCRGRLRVRAQRLKQRALAKKLRAESIAEEKRAKELKLEVKLREAEAKQARERGREAAAAARKEAEDAKLRRKEEAQRVLEAREAESRMRLKIAAKLCGETQAYLGASSQGKDRIKRAARLAIAAASRKEGLKAWSVPDFWPPSTAGLMKVTVPGKKSSGALHNVMWGQS